MYIDPSGNNALSSAIVEIGAAMISASYEVSYVAYVALLASIFVMATVEIVGTACGMSPDEIRTLAFEFVKQIGIFTFLIALTILAVYSPILAALSLAIGCTFLTIGTFELYVSLKEGDYKRAALMGILLILGFKGVVGEVNALKPGAASIKSGGNIAEKSGSCKSNELITNKFPNEEIPTDGYKLDYYISDGKIKGIDGRKGNFDFVITKDGQLLIGRKHHYLGNAEDVVAAGQIKINGKGEIKRIDNLSGHYQPTVEQAMIYQTLFEQQGLVLNNTWLEYYYIPVDSKGYCGDVVLKYIKMIKGVK